jgi:hypothetical protein
MQTTTFTLNDNQRARADTLVDPALAFLAEKRYPLGAALARHLWRDGPADDVVTALAAYQNEDGGFGNGLEVDIAAPVSNPFATRLALQVLAQLPPDVGEKLRASLAGWLAASQDADGDWHFAPEVREQDLAPWFAGWTFPSLNPACCLVGLANGLGIATPEMRERVAELFDRLGSIDEARTGEFYAVLPYVEYVAGVQFPERDAYVAALAEGIAGRKYEDAQHFFDHAINGGPELVARLPNDLLSSQADRLMDEVEDDGGWPTPYNPAWRPWTTASAMVTLARLRDGV